MERKKVPGSDAPLYVFKDKRLESQLRDIEEQNYDGIDKTWVNNIMLAHRMHYRKVARQRK